MKLTAGFLMVLPALAWAENRRPQDWFGAPVLPEIFRTDDPPTLDDLRLPDRPSTSPQQQPPPSETAWGRGLTALDLRAWQEEDDLKIVREWAGDALLGVPLLVPQLILEAALPRGLQIGPTTFLYRTSPSSSSLVLVVLDQLLFHEAEFLAQAQATADDTWDSEDLTRGQRRLLRRSLMTGLRATYAMPGLTMGLVLKTAADQGPAGLLLIPPLGGALLYFKGIDQKLHLEDHVKMRVKLASGRDWHRGVGSDSGIPALSFELRFCDLPIGILGSFELSSRGMEPAFIGIGTSLDAMEAVLGREERRHWRPD